VRELFRSLALWRVALEDHGLDTIRGPGGEEWSIWDVEYLLSCTAKLPTQQRRAIDLCLVQGYREKDAAVMMGVSATNPVAMYATKGIERLIKWAKAGKLPNFSPDKVLV
jgi:DNA-directed RNA polymerase specialized sigma24 family protein